MDTDKTFRLLSLGFPTSVIVALLNVGLSSGVFFVPRLIGDRLPIALRRLLRLATTGSVAAAACALALWNWAACGSAELCARSPLPEAGCLRAQSVTVVVMLMSLFVERAAFALAGVSYSRTARVADSVGLALVWLFLSERDPLSVLAVATVLLRKVVYLWRSVGRLLVALASVSLGCVCLLAAGGKCATVSSKDAAGGLLLAVYAPLV